MIRPDEHEAPAERDDEALVEHGLAPFAFGERNVLVHGVEPEAEQHRCRYEASHAEPH